MNRLLERTRAFAILVVLSGCGPCDVQKPVPLTSISTADLVRDRAGARKFAPLHGTYAIVVAPWDFLRDSVARIFIEHGLAEKRNGRISLTESAKKNVRFIGQGLFYIDIGDDVSTDFRSASEFTACDETHSAERDYAFRQKVIKLNSLGTALFRGSLLYRYRSVDDTAGSRWTGIEEQLDERYEITIVAPSPGILLGDYLGFPWSGRKLN